MNKIIFKWPVKTRKILITLFVMFSLYISDNVFAIAHWNQKLMKCTWESPKKNRLVISAAVYNHSFGPNSVHGYLEHCKFEASADDKTYFHLMDIRTQRQNNPFYTTINFANKLNRAKMEFINTTNFTKTNWPDAQNSNIEITVPNKEKRALVSVLWHVDRYYKDIVYIRVSGKWAVDPPYSCDDITDVLYKIEQPVKSMLKSNTKNDTVNVFNESEAIVIKGADLVANIKVYNTSGVEINSVISNNDVVKIKVPAKQIYIVHIGKSRYKVAL